MCWVTAAVAAAAAGGGREADQAASSSKHVQIASTITLTCCSSLSAGNTAEAGRNLWLGDCEARDVITPQQLYAQIRMQFVAISEGALPPASVVLGLSWSTAGRLWRATRLKSTVCATAVRSSLDPGALPLHTKGRSAKGRLPHLYSPAAVCAALEELEKAVQAHQTMLRRSAATAVAAVQRARLAHCSSLPTAGPAAPSRGLSARATPAWCILPEHAQLPPTVCTGCAAGRVKSAYNICRPCD